VKKFITICKESKSLEIYNELYGKVFWNKKEEIYF